MKTLPADVGNEPHWVSRQAFQIVIIMALFAEITMFLILKNEVSLWWAVPVVLVISHLMHGAAVGFHEASHGLLRRNRKFNEFDGVLIGLLSFMSFSLYRASHQSHHAHFTTERDEELWPFVFTSSPRWFRVLIAIFELTFGMFFVPFLFLRTFLRKGSPIRSKKVRKRIWQEFALMGVLWVVILTTVAFFGLWKYFLWMYFIPTFIAGDLQSWRKYIEHVGLTGSTINSGTRNIVADTWTGKLVAFTLLHEPYHGLHHLHVGLPHAELPRLAPELEPKHPDEIHPFPSYRHAMLHLFRALADPRVGAQWNRRENSPV
ncbi:fatty acid desaturase [Luteolibacter yonseiensis]|uniref:Fatty acid desaturase n=1 Tax=Luteolibacter yonseiensis TaxID=1144680 RepID=A0A934RA64_9BACT|nr:fatty acid desaturase [Luteolibacter yonseiensis]MBK1817990.1 fatty acid desaturase [Luteolibacter yonseiensis]